jgi:hypothetical protein
MEWKEMDKKSQDFLLMLERRNNRFLNFFKKYGFTETRLIGDPEKPALLFNEELVLSCYVHNFELRLMDKPFSENVIEVIKLNGINTEEYSEVLKEWFETYEHRKVYKIQFTDAELYLAGYNFLVRRKENPEGRYPVFARHHPKVYFSLEKAQEIASELDKAGYKVSVI